ncbi:hypothetical protein LCGC14_3043490, partial [marine sediment metagenome]
MLFLDADIHSVEGLEESIFEGFDADIGICTESLQPKLRAQTKVGQINKQQDELWAKNVEEKWNIKLPRTEEGLLKVYNSGLVLYSNRGLLNAKKNFLPFAEYIKYVLSIKGLLPFYAADQNYIHTTLFISNTNFIELDKGWNTFVTLHERNRQRIIMDRDDNTKLVHIQFAGANHFSEEQLEKHFDFYEPFTVHESSLSPCVHSIQAAKLDRMEQAYTFYLRTSRLDLDDYNKEVHEGLHITSMAGTWMSVIEGFGGMRIKED